MCKNSMYIQNLKKVRKELSLSVDELSKRLDIPARTLGGYERGERKMSLEVVTQMCKKLNINANWFVTGEGEMFNPKAVSLNDETVSRKEIIEIVEIVIQTLKKRGLQAV